MSDEYDDNVVDLAAFRKQKEAEAEEKAKKEAEEEELENIEYLQYILGSIMSQMGDPKKTGSLFYVPMSDNDYNSYYTFESGYNDEGYYESTWEWDGFEEEDDEEDF